MKNSFYNDFDIQSIKERNTDYRTPFQIDRDRIIHSFAFRRLQAKTQVFFSGEYDFYRTRLTHSIEVAQIGRSICNYLKSQNDILNEHCYIDPDLVEAACLSHDLGHPPFGHAGEKILNDFMREYGGFEGNGQTLRILTETIYSKPDMRKGMSPTRAFIDSILKYKTLYSQLENPENHFIYDDQAHILDFVFNNEKFPQELQPGKPLNSFKSIECQIMDWADDTSYSLNDMVDSIKTGFITFEKVEKWALDRGLNQEEVDVVDNVLKIIRTGNVESRFGVKIGDFIKACQLKERSNFMSEKTNRYRYELVIDPQVKQVCNVYKKLSKELVFDSPQLKQLEFKGHYMIKRLMNTFLENYLGEKNFLDSLLPKELEYSISQNKNNKTVIARLLCDYVAGMTDRYAIRIYKRLFHPDFGSIIDLI